MALDGSGSQRLLAGRLTINNWKGRWNYDVKRLVAGTSYEAEAWP